MSNYLIEQYHKDLEKSYATADRAKNLHPKRLSQTAEQILPDQRLSAYSQARLQIAQWKTVYPDGTVKDALRLKWGFWESKDTYDDLDQEIQKKIDKGYLIKNILLEDETAVLIQAN